MIKKQIAFILALSFSALQCSVSTQENADINRTTLLCQRMMEEILHQGETPFKTLFTKKTLTESENIARIVNFSDIEFQYENDHNTESLRLTPKTQKIAQKSGIPRITYSPKTIATFKLVQFFANNPEYLAIFDSKKRRKFLETMDDFIKKILNNDSESDSDSDSESDSDSDSGYDSSSESEDPLYLDEEDIDTIISAKGITSFFNKHLTKGEKNPNILANLITYMKKTYGDSIFNTYAIKDRVKAQEINIETIITIILGLDNEKHIPNCIKALPKGVAHKLLSIPYSPIKMYSTRWPTREELKDAYKLELLKKEYVDKINLKKTLDDFKNKLQKKYCKLQKKYNEKHSSYKFKKLFNKLLYKIIENIRYEEDEDLLPGCHILKDIFPKETLNLEEITNNMRTIIDSFSSKILKGIKEKKDFGTFKDDLNTFKKELTKNIRQRNCSQNLSNMFMSLYPKLEEMYTHRAFSSHFSPRPSIFPLSVLLNKDTVSLELLKNIIKKYKPAIDTVEIENYISGASLSKKKKNRKKAEDLQTVLNWYNKK